MPDENKRPTAKELLSDPKHASDKEWFRDIMKGIATEEAAKETPPPAPAVSATNIFDQWFGGKK